MISVSEVIREAATRFDLSPELLRGPRRLRGISHKRQIAYLIAAELCPHISIMGIAREFGDRDHATILYGIERAKLRIRENPELRKITDSICADLRSRSDLDG